MKNNYIQNYLKSSMNKGECKIIDHNWQCKLTYVEYKPLNYFEGGIKKFRDNSILTFNFKENKLTIPKKYYNSIVRSFYYYKGRIRYNKDCLMFGDVLYCTCNNKDKFGIVTFYFEKNTMLDIDLRDYIYYDNGLFINKNNDYIMCATENFKFNR